MEGRWPGGIASSSQASSSSQQAPKRGRSPTADRVKDKEADEEDEGPPPSQEMDEHYVTLRTDVVGVQYYRGMVGKGEYVMLRREPGNQYDSNAVQVLNVSGVQVGHIPRLVASRISPFMDEHLISVEGRMIGQNLDLAKHYKLGLDMSIYAKPSHRSVLEPELAWAFEAARARAQTATAPKKDPKFKGKGRMLGGDTGVAGTAGSGVGLPPGPMDEELRRLMDGLKKVGEDEKQADGVMDSLTKDLDVSKLPMHPNPPGLAKGNLHVDLLPHQSQALQWMIEREHPKLPTKPTDPAVQFWVKQGAEKGNGRDYWLNVATRTPQQEDPVLGRGGIIADGMGLGKTLTTLALVLATKADTVKAGESKATLIVCPLSVLSNWEKQIQDHVVGGNLTSYTYHGQGKGVTAKTLESYDVVITTYQTVTSDLADSVAPSASQAKKQKANLGPLGKVSWKRVVADEGHVLKNPKARMTKAFAALQAGCRWVCTGTPIVNSPSDLGSLLTCIQVCKPLDQVQRTHLAQPQIDKLIIQPDYFKALLLRPLKNGDGNAAKLLQAVVGQSLLRRTKDSKDANGRRLVELPPLEFFRCPVQLDTETRAMYDEITEVGRKRLESAIRTGQGAGNVLQMLTRLRQLCLSADLVPQSFLESMRQPVDDAGGVGDGKATSAKAISAEKKEELFEKLKRCLADDEECAICSDNMERDLARITNCGHTACISCFSAWLVKSTTCPICRHSITPASLLELPPDEAAYVEADKNAKTIKSAKINELVKYLKLFDGSDKTLVFSQFTSFLDHVGVALKEAGITFCRFDGSMPAKKRQEVIATFQKPLTGTDDKTNPKVMLISLKSGAVGLNLTAASNVFLSAIEAQAIDRAHRMGQRKPVRVFQLIAEDTIESKVLDIQKRKDALVAKAFEKSSKESAQAKREARFDELKELLGVR